MMTHSKMFFSDGEYSAYTRRTKPHWFVGVIYHKKRKLGETHECYTRRAALDEAIEDIAQMTVYNERTG